MAELFNYYQDQQKKKQPGQEQGLSQALSAGGTENPYTAAGDSGGNIYKAPSGPVNGNGTIPEPQAPPSQPAPAPQPVLQQAQMPATGSFGTQVDVVKHPTIPAGGPATVPPPAPAADPNALPPGATDMGNGLVKFADGQILPRNHPAYAAKVASLGPATPAAPAGTPGTPAAAPPPEAYGAAADTNTTMHDLVNKLLANPSSMSDQYVSQLKEQSKENSVGLADQLQKKLKLDAAARGVTGSGNEAFRGEKIGEAMNSDILKGYRDVDMQKASQDRQDLLNAMGFGEQYNKDAQGNYFANLDAQRANKGLDIQSALGTAANQNDANRLSESGREFDLQHALALKQFLENQRQFNNQMGFNYNSLDQQGQNSALSQLMGLF